MSLADREHGFVTAEQDFVAARVAALFNLKSKPALRTIGRAARKLFKAGAIKLRAVPATTDGPQRWIAVYQLLELEPGAKAREAWNGRGGKPERPARWVGWSPLADAVLNDRLSAKLADPLRLVFSDGTETTLDLGSLRARPGGWTWKRKPSQEPGSVKDTYDPENGAGKPSELARRARAEKPEETGTFDGFSAPDLSFLTLQKEHDVQGSADVLAVGTTALRADGSVTSRASRNGSQGPNPDPTPESSTTKHSRAAEPLSPAINGHAGNAGPLVEAPRAPKRRAPKGCFGWVQRFDFWRQHYAQPEGRTWGVFEGMEDGGTVNLRDQLRALLADMFTTNGRCDLYLRCLWFHVSNGDTYAEDYDKLAWTILSELRADEAIDPNPNELLREEEIVELNWELEDERQAARDKRKAESGKSLRAAFNAPAAAPLAAYMDAENEDRTPFDRKRAIRDVRHLLGKSGKGVHLARLPDDALARMRDKLLHYKSMELEHAKKVRAALQQSEQAAALRELGAAAKRRAG